jgi:hypothetical protein
MLLPTIINPRRALRLLACLVGLGCGVVGYGQEVVTPQPMKPAVAEFKEAMPPAPQNGILDLAELFSTEQKQALAAKLRLFREQQGFQIYIAAYTFVYGEDSNQRAERLHSQWLKGRPGAVVVYDKGGTGSSGVLGMACLDGALSAQMNLGIILSAKNVAEKNPEAVPSQRLQAAVEEIMAGYARVRPVIDESQRSQRMSQWKILAGVLGVMLLSLGILSFTQRYQKKLAVRDAESYLFPYAEISPRYGAPYGGGVVVQMHYGKSE